jgi:hypothetical protein
MKEVLAIAITCYQFSFTYTTANKIAPAIENKPKDARNSLSVKTKQSTTPSEISADPTTINIKRAESFATITVVPSHQLPCGITVELCGGRKV